MNWRHLALTFMVCFLGTGLFILADLPLPMLLGPIFACLVGALVGLPLRDAGPVNKSMRTILGVAVGASLTPALFGRLPDMALSVALVPLFVLTIGAIGYPWFRRICGFDHPTSYYCAMPGGLQDMVIFGEEAGGNIRALSLVHATRVLAIVSAAPFLLHYFWGLDLSNPPGEPASTIPLHELALMVFCGLVGWWGAARLGMFGAGILGPLILTGALSLTGFITHRPPAEAIYLAQFFIGMGVGVKYVGVTLNEVRKVILAALGYSGLLAIIALVFSEIVIWLTDAHSLEAFLAFAPGGQAEMAVLTIIAGADIAFVITHHLVRLFVVILGAPIVAHLLLRKSKLKASR
jgi:membrane AbrB-like protein